MPDTERRAGLKTRQFTDNLLHLGMSYRAKIQGQIDKGTDLYFYDNNRFL